MAPLLRSSSSRRLLFLSSLCSSHVKVFPLGLSANVRYTRYNPHEHAPKFGGRRAGRPRHVHDGTPATPRTATLHSWHIQLLKTTQASRIGGRDTHQTKLLCSLAPPQRSTKAHRATNQQRPCRRWPERVRRLAGRPSGARARTRARAAGPWPEERGRNATRRAGRGGCVGWNAVRGTTRRARSSTFTQGKFTQCRPQRRAGRRRQTALACSEAQRAASAPDGLGLL